MHSFFAAAALVFALFQPLEKVEKTVFKTENGAIEFTSQASLELIEAHSKRLRGAVDVENMTFAFSVEIRSFEGFNSPLQKEHFNENYLESKKFPKATFAGKLIEQPDFDQKGPQTVRAKGKLVVHGIERERILKVSIEPKTGGKMAVRASFSVTLDDHDIAIPKIVNQKIAEEINVSIEAVLTNE